LIIQGLVLYLWEWFHCLDWNKLRESLL
jgi:hypothetical protein